MALHNARKNSRIGSLSEDSNIATTKIVLLDTHLSSSVSETFRKANH